MNQSSGWGVTTRALLFVVCSAVLLAISSRWIKETLAMACVAALTTLCLTQLFAQWENASLADMGAKLSSGSLWRFAIAFAVGLTLPVLRAGIVMITTSVRYERVQGLIPGQIAFALTTYFLLAAREELAFRGYPLRMLDRRFGAWTAQLIMAALFSLEHAIGGWTWWQALFGSGVGALLFGAASLRTRGLAVPIGLHAAWNFGDAMLGGKGTPGLWRPVVDATTAPERVEMTQWIAYIFVMMAAATVIWLWPRGNVEQSQANRIRPLRHGSDSSSGSR